MSTEPWHSESYVRTDTTMREVMTPTPRVVERTAKITDAHGLMRSLRCRHLPVVERGELVGVVSERDLLLVESLVGADSTVDEVGDAMTPGVYTTTPDARLRDVARVMAAERYGSAIVMEDGHILGIFTATDAFRHIVSALR